MKAKFFLLGLCALALAACSIDEVSQINDSNAIQFKATTATRATATTTNNIASFSVWAWNTSDGLTNEFMDGVVAKRNGSSNTFTTSPLYFWPTGTVDFYAVSPEAVTFGIQDNAEYAYFGGEISEGDDEGTSWTYTGNVAKATIDNDNIVFDVTIPSKAEDQIDLCYAINKKQSSGGVAMNFRHALSQVVFKAKNVNEDFVVDIAGVSVCSVYKTGTYTLKEVEPTTTQLATADAGTSEISSSQGSWTTEAHKARFAAGIATTNLPYNEGETVEIMADGGALMLLPQEVEKWDVYTDVTDESLGSYIAVLCRVTEHGSLLWPNANEEGNTELVDGVEYAYIAMPVDVAWEEGYRYTYTIVFGEGLGYYPPDDTNWDLEGTPVLVPITFDVTVDEFQDTEGVDVTTKTGVVTNAADLKAAVAAQYSPIEIAADITLDGYLEIDYDCELTIDAGCTLTGPDGTEDCHIDWETDYGYYTAIIYVKGGNLTIYGEGTVETVGTNESDYTNAIFVEDGTVTIYGGTYKGSNWNGDVSDLYTRSAVYCSEGGYAYIYGGDFYAGPSSRNNKDLDYGYHWVLNIHNSAYTDGNAMIYCYGGTYHDGFDPASPHTDDADSYCADGYGTVYDEETNTYTVVPIVTPTSYADLQAALEDGAPIITIATDMEIGDELDFTSDCVLTIEPGVTVSVPADDSDCYGYESSIIKAWNGATVDIYAEGATFATQGGAESVDISAIWVYGGATVNVYGGTYKGGIWTDPNGEIKSGSSATVYAEDGFVNIYDGTFMGGKSGSMQQTSILNCLDSGYKASPRTADIVCYGGTYQNFDPASNNSEDGTRQGLTNFCADGYTTVQSDEVDDAGFYWYTVVAQ